MGFWDNMKKGAEYAKKGMEALDEGFKRQIAKMSDEQLKEMYSKNPNNKYVIQEMNKRGI